MQSLAIVGSGIAGLGCAYLLAGDYALTIFEGEDYSGGHTRTITVDGGVTFDTGFMVFNYETYPLLTRLFANIGLPVKKTDMSFSVQHKPTGVEWNGAGMDKVFAQRRNLLNARFWRMLLKLDWFNKNAPAHLERPELAGQTVREYVEANKLGQDFVDWYLIPMGASVWSTPPGKMLDFPAASLIRFFHNHGFLGLDTHYQWYTVDGGASSYIPLLTRACGDIIRLNEKVQSVQATADGALVTTPAGVQKFDKVILATHADQALALLTTPSALQYRLLNPFKYQDNRITVHSDDSVMPTSRHAWASWNYRYAGDGYPAAGAGQLDSPSYLATPPTLHYWMNSLQGLGGTKNYFVSLNSESVIDPALVHRSLDYSHPLFDLATFAAQAELPTLNKQSDEQSIYFCGSYFKYGFHEDAYRSAVDLASIILKREAFA